MVAMAIILMMGKTMATEAFRDNVVKWLTTKHSLRKETARQLVARYDKELTEREAVGRSAKGIAYDIDNTYAHWPVKQ